MVLLVFFSQAPTETSSALLAVYDAFQRALRDADVSALDHLLADQFVWTHSDGYVQDKSDLLKQIRNRALRYVELKTDQMSFDEYHNSAVITGTAERRLSNSAEQLHFRYTLALVKRRRTWRLAAYHTAILLPGTRQPLQIRLEYPADARLLILNADDLVVSHSEDLASLAALDKNLITSATVMVPCPWFTEVAAYAKAHLEKDLGLHLTLTSEWQNYRWEPVSPRALVPSLIGQDGYFYTNFLSDEYSGQQNEDVSSLFGDGRRRGRCPDLPGNPLPHRGRNSAEARDTNSGHGLQPLPAAGSQS